MSESKIKPVIICIAKSETQYIEEFVRYHLHLGFDKIYIYDNEDEPTYGAQLARFNDYVKVMHLPGKNYPRLPQYEALQQFTWQYMGNNDITHVAHIDIDEFIVLKKHKNIKDFIREYIDNDENNIMCGGIGINWRFFGSSDITTNTGEPNTSRFTKCEKNGNRHIKTLYNAKYHASYPNPHECIVNNASYPIKTTNGTVIKGPFNEPIDFSVIQINHYKTKTWEEFQYIKQRGRADRCDNPELDDLLGTFNEFNLNEIEDLTAHDYYKHILNSPELLSIYETTN